MSRSVVETVLGAFVLIGALVFLIFSYSEGDAGSVTGYKISANFSGIGGLKVGDEIQVSGVKVGQVAKIELDPEQYLARVTMEIDDSIPLPDDTVALISSQSLLGGKYLALEPGGSPDMLEEGGEILYTQAPQNLEELLGKFIFSMQKADKPEAAPASSPAPVVTAPVVAPEPAAEKPAVAQPAPSLPLNVPAVPQEAQEEDLTQ
ncbi:MAG TPA: outer membrane lipid asymmetry maintenance protein MlaD [Alphaproteobacteria bacterium]|nr:outer membrane lipid asymmetry maintenance protein MlaD [Alphaproteobacteria bacterium]